MTPRLRVRVAPHVVAQRSDSGDSLATPLWRVPLSDLGAIERLGSYEGESLRVLVQDPELERVALLGLLICEVIGSTGVVARGEGPVDLRCGSDDGTALDPMDGTVAHVIGESVSVHFVRTGATVEMTREVFASLVDRRSAEPATSALRTLLLGYARAEGAHRPQETWQEAAFREHAGMALWKDVGVSFGARPNPPKSVVRRNRPLRSDPGQYDAPGVNPHFAKLARDRRSVRDFDEHPVDRDELSVHLAAVCGLRSSWRGRWGHVVARTSVPSAGALNTLDVTVLAFRLDGPQGVFQFDRETLALTHVGSFEDPDAARRLARAAAMSTGATRPAPAMVVLSAADARTHGKYAGFPYANAYKEAGATLTALQYSMVDSSLGTCPLGAIIDDDFRRVVPHRFDDHVVFGAAVVGSRSAESD